VTIVKKDENGYKSEGFKTKTAKLALFKLKSAETVSIPLPQYILQKN